MKKNQKMIAAAAAIVVIALLFVGIWFATRPETSGGGKSFTVEVVHGDESTKEFHYQSDAEYLGDALLEEGLIQGDEGDFGLYITQVDGETADYNTDQSYWALYQNGEYAQQGIDQTPLYDGDQYSLVYTIG